jgi:DNA-binding NarL/FixJ family response regulator
VETALGLVEEHRPDVFIASTDAADAADGGIRCIARAHQRWPGLKSVVLAPDYDPKQIDAAFAAGASVCCIKRAAVDDLAVAIRQAFEHSIFLASSHGTQAPVRVAPVGVGRTEGINVLTRREIEILRLVAEGHSNSALAKMLWVTEQTVKFHLANIYRKLDVANRTEASRWAHLNGMLTPAVNAA